MPWLSSSRAVAAMGVALAVATVAVYLNTLSVPFFFDDDQSITDNQTIRRLWPLSEPLSPPHDGAGVENRPIVNLSLALNYAMGGLNPRVYHATNVLFHVGAALVLFGLVRRTLLMPALRARFGDVASPLAWLAAAAWALHPLQTETVTCTIQRTEGLFSLFFLATLYAFARHASDPARKVWPVLAVGFCLLGMGSKEVMVSAPLMALLYDRTFVAGNFREAWRRRARVYVGLAATWVLLAGLVLTGGGTRGTAAGFGVGVSAWQYALKQCEAIVIYLKLSLWPHPLVLDYGRGIATHLAEVWWQAIVVVALVVGVALALVRRPMAGFLGAWILVILAPSSSFLPLVSQTMAEHRMYLPLAALTVALAVGVQSAMRAGWWRVAAAIVLGLGVLTARRNQEYQTDIRIWHDTVAKVPDNARARINLGLALKRERRYDEAMVHLRHAVRIRPTAEAFSNVGATLLEMDRAAEAIEPCREALKLDSKFAMAHNNLGSALTRTGNVAEARRHLEMALQLNPTLAPAHSNLAAILLAEGRLAEAMAHAREALRLKPELWNAHENLGYALLMAGQPAAAIAPLEQAVAHMAPNAIRSSNLGVALYQVGRPGDAIPHFEAALRIEPDFLDAL
ncbi:MAG TPA: tetratricopeptide repeat protein, partial [Opitutaceae bacterium]|nr:tetratricopeptide repeat protein [Opitutaceae bacterium]